jgi:hypothetical protein
VKHYIFVVRHLSSDVILGRPWGSLTHAQSINEDDRSYTVRIHSLDERKSAEFVVVRTDHWGSRGCITPAEEGVLSADFNAWHFY